MRNAITVHNNPMPLVEFQGQRLTSPTQAGSAQAENLSKLDMRSRPADGPAARKKGEEYLENGRVKSDTPIPDDHLVCSLDVFIELARRCGDEFQKITVPTKFTGQILVTARNGLVTCQQELTDKHFVTTLDSIAEIAQQVGFSTIKSDTKQ